MSVEGHESAVLRKGITAAEARVIEALLGGAGIPVLLTGGSLALTDEYSQARRALGPPDIKVEVPKDRLADAQRLLEEAHQVGEALDEMDEA